MKETRRKDGREKQTLDRLLALQVVLSVVKKEVTWLHILGKQRLAYLSCAAGAHGIRCVIFGAVPRLTRRKSGTLMIELGAIINTLPSLSYLPYSLRRV